MAQTYYDLQLFKQLNEEYADRPLVPKPRNLEPKGMFEQAEARAIRLDKLIGLRGKRVLEVGCGRGHLSTVLAREYDCEVVGLDVREYPDWTGDCLHPNTDLRHHDISSDDNARLGTFDRAVSMSVWEHIEHPHAALVGLRSVLNPSAKAYISANLYRGPAASHRYREVYFPWPHLLFEEEVFRQFYEDLGRPATGPAWVNKLTSAHYHLYLRQLDLEILREWNSTTPIDEEFYERFSNKLARYPRYDLEQDFIHVIVTPLPAPVEEDQKPEDSASPGAETEAETSVGESAKAEGDAPDSDESRSERLVDEEQKSKGGTPLGSAIRTLKSYASGVINKGDKQ